LPKRRFANNTGHRDGPKEQALFDHPTDVTFSQCGKFIIICEFNNIRYMKIKN
jgi:hypothetical protein